MTERERQAHLKKKTIRYSVTVRRLVASEKCILHKLLRIQKSKKHLPLIFSSSCGWSNNTRIPVRYTSDQKKQYLYNLLYHNLVHQDQRR